MKIEGLSLYSYEIPLTNQQIRSGVLVKITDASGATGWGEIAPLPKWSQEELQESLDQLKKRKAEICTIDWTLQNCLHMIAELKLFPSVSFGIESALLNMLSPLEAYSVTASALLMGTKEEILQQAVLRKNEGYTSTKLKVSNLSFEDAVFVIFALKDSFHLRIDVNRAWSRKDSLTFFSQFALDTFDYVEEPFKNPRELHLFPHPLAVDESFPHDLSLQQLEKLPTLKALIYKPTIQGGMSNCLPLHKWANQRGIKFVLSSSFESDVGLANIASIAKRLELSVPIGIGTFHFLKDYMCESPLRFHNAKLQVPDQLQIKRLKPNGKEFRKLSL